MRKVQMQMSHQENFKRCVYTFERIIDALPSTICELTACFPQWRVPERWYDTQAALFQALEVEFNAKKGILAFDAAYTIPDGSGTDSMEKWAERDTDLIHSLSHSVWESTQRRWT